MCHDHRIPEREPARDAVDAGETEAEPAEREADLERALTGEDGRVFVPPADD